MRWRQWNAFHKSTYAERYHELWRRLCSYNLGIGPETDLIDTVVILAAAYEEALQKIEQDEIDRSFV